MIASQSLRSLSAEGFASAERTRIFVLTIIAGLVSAFYGLLVIQVEVLSVAVFVHWVILTATIWRPRYGLYAVFFLMVLLEPGGADPLMGFGAYLHGGLTSTFNLSFLATTPLELLLLFTFASWLAQQAMRRNFRFERGTLAWPISLFMLAIITGLARGITNGGNFQIGLWETRALSYIVLCYFLATNVINTRGHVRALLSLTVCGTVLYAAEGAFRKFAFLDTKVLDVIPDFAYSHEMVIFIAVTVIGVMAHVAFGGARWIRWSALLLIGICIFTLLASERRAGFIALAISFVAFAAVLAVSNRRSFLLMAVPIALVAAVYFPVFWNASGMVGQPARAVRSIFSPDPRDAASNGYRDMEKINVRATIQSNPLLGVGFGKEFLFVVPLPDLSWWPFWHYEPHHNVMWVWLKTGAHGFIIFLALMGIAVARATNLARRLKTPECRVFAIMSLTGILSTLVFSYVDLGLVVGRVTIWLGIALGVLGVLGSIDAKTQVEKGSAA